MTLLLFSLTIHFFIYLGFSALHVNKCQWFKFFYFFMSEFKKNICFKNVSFKLKLNSEVNHYRICLKSNLFYVTNIKKKIIFFCLLFFLKNKKKNSSIKFPLIKICFYLFKQEIIK